ncbi:negative elongation factor B-like [Acropora muricata]|uniref:negative elongation factor B-like n=1 Tax=Acropora muricata TaxID=159855 RepID=UPI0034E3A0BF
MAGFDQAGLPGTEFILNGLNNAQDFEVVNFVEHFQQENSIMLPSLQSALPFLDLHGVRRLEFNKFVMDNLREKLLEQLKKLEAEKLQALLDQSFPFIHVPHLRPVVIEVMKYLPKVPEECLEQLANDPKLYEDCAIEVKRQIWVKHHALFGDAVGPLLNQYVEAKYNVLFSTEPVNSHTFFSVPSKTRRQNTVVQSLAKMIGKSLELYNLVLQFLRTLFLRTKEVHYCTLRSELLMAVHDLEIKDIKDIDPCHKFTWCLDACIRERVIEGKRTKELQGFLDHAKHSEEQVLGDIAMILCDPFAINTVCISVVKQLQRLVNAELLPRSSSDVSFLLRVLNLGVSAWEMISNQHFTEIALSGELVHKFLPFLMSLMVDSNLHSIGNKTCDTDENGAAAEGPLQFLGYFVEITSTNSVAFTLAWCYLLHVIKQKDRHTLMTILPWYVGCCQDRFIDDVSLHTLISSLAAWHEEFSHGDFCELVFDQFLVPLVSHSSILRHTLRLLWYVVPKMDPQKVVNILTITQPSSEHNEAIHDLHGLLIERVASFNALTPSSSSVDQPSSASSLSSSHSPLEYIQPAST